MFQNNLLPQRSLANYQAALHAERILSEVALREKAGMAFQSLSLMPPTQPNAWSELLPPPELNIATMPQLFRDTCSCIGSRFNFNPGDISLPALLALATSTCGRFVVHVKDSWEEAVCLYGAFIKDSGLIKTGMVKGVFSPLLEFNEECKCCCKGNQYKLKSIDFVKKKNQKTLDALIIECHRSRGYALFNEKVNAIEEEEKQLYSDLRAYKVPPLLLGDGMSIAAINRRLYEQSGKFTILSMEDPFIKAKLGSKGQDISILQNAYDGVDSSPTTSGGKLMQITKPMLNIFTLIQPELLYNYFDNPSLHANGFLNRLLVVFGSDVTHHRLHVFDESALPEFHRRLAYLVRAHYTQDVDRQLLTLKLSSDALDRLEQYRIYLDREYASYTSQNPTTCCINSGYIQKDRGAAVRIAALLHILEYCENPCQVEIGVEHVNAACNLLCQLISHHAYANASKLRRQSYNAKRILSWLSRHDFGCFYVTDITQGLNNISKEECKDALLLLERYCWVRPVQVVGKPVVYVAHQKVIQQCRYLMQ